MFDDRQTKKQIIEGGMKLHALYVESWAEARRLRAALTEIRDGEELTGAECMAIATVALTPAQDQGGS